MKNVLITGGFGFIGFNALLDWSQKFPNCKFFNMDCETYAAQFKLKEKKTLLKKLGVKSFKNNIVDPVACEKIVEDNQIDTIVNFAAESHVDNSIVSPRVFFDTNVIGTANLLDASRKFNCRFHQISTDEVIGAISPEMDIDSTENAKLDPSSPYSSSKASAELIVNSYVKTFGVKATISRCTNNIGPWQHIEKMVPKTITNAICDKKIPVYGDGKQRRFWIDVKSHNEAVIKILSCGTIGETYNIAPKKDNLITNITLVKKILKALGKNENLIEHVKDRAAHDVCYWLDASKIEKELGFVDNKDFDTTLNETIDWYKKEYSI